MPVSSAIDTNLVVFCEEVASTKYLFNRGAKVYAFREDLYISFTESENNIFLVPYMGGNKTIYEASLKG